ncbi:MAG: alpha/beta fold hydrolase [Fimbriimonadaceae bacterium]|nr:alpha/beta fold hydrolase [Fimbriimonadaceae bacterium]QYK57375.1 MAG: alpha/beta fold hydrolase [Fimbriimonadaceae bacterium]
MIRPLSAIALLVACLFAYGQSPERGEPLPRRGALGLQIVAMSAEEAKEAGLSAGVKAGTVSPGLTSESLGVQQGDLLLSLNGAPLATAATVTAAVRSMSGGDKVTLEVLREGKKLSLTGTLAPRPRQQPDGFQVHYDQVVSKGKRIRIIATTPEGDGRFPTVFLIGGIGGYSVDGEFASIAYGKVLGPIARAGYATVRIDKPGQGDSEGPAYSDLLFDDELDAYLQALRLAKTLPYVDKERIAIFGHSMGGVFGPLVASQEKVAGVAVNGTLAKTWAEYWLENSRRQSLLAGQAPGEVNAQMQELAKLTAALFIEMTPLTKVLETRPDLAEIAKATSPDGKTMSGVNVAFFQQLAQRNLVEAWEKTDAQVLALWGENDFISTQWDHEHIAFTVNRLRPGTAEYKSLPNSDHGFSRTESFQDSMAKWGRPGAEHNPNIEETLIDWLRKTLK